MSPAEPVDPPDRSLAPRGARLRSTAAHPGCGGILRADPEDFQVEERLPYAPSGEGGHLFVQIRKRGLTTLEAARRLAEQVGLGGRRGLPPELGFAGMKDRWSIATQWISLPRSPEVEAALARFSDSELELLELRPHDKKLRRGHVASNHFKILLSGVPEGGLARAEACLAALKAEGVPNDFGAQRFGREGDNAARGLAILRGEQRPPRERRLRDLLMSAVQSALFNRLLQERIERGELCLPLVGDLMQKHETGGMFWVEEVAAEAPRVAALEISPTGPLFGKKTRPAKGEALAREQAALAALSIPEEAARRLGPGGRRLLRYPLRGARVQAGPTQDSLHLEFSLPAGAYATVLLDELVKPAEGVFTRAAPS